MNIPRSSLISIPTYKRPFPIKLGTTALIIIDMQNDFCHPDGFSSSKLGLDITATRQIIPSIQRLLSWARQEEILIVYTKESHRPDLSDLTASKKLRHENAGFPIGALGQMGKCLIQGEQGTEIINELQPSESEAQVDKPEHSAFANSDLESILRRKGITNLLITGVTTECCVLGTYRHASDLGFFCLLLEDCCAAFNERDHKAAIEVVLAENGAIGWVTSSTKLLSAMKKR